MNRFWERVMLVLVVCVPVPALALSGLSVPLPSVVERVAAALVPFVGAATLDGETTLASGAIVHMPAREATSTTTRAEPAKAGTGRVSRSGGAAPASRQSRRGEAVRVSGGASKTGPATPHGEPPADDAPKAPDPVPEAPAPTGPTDSDEQPADKGEDPSPPVEPDVRPTPTKDDADVVPTVDADVKPADDTVVPPREPDVKPPTDTSGSNNGERRDEAAPDAPTDAAGK